MVYTKNEKFGNIAIYITVTKKFIFCVNQKLVKMIIYNSIIPFKGFTAINLFGIIFVRNEYEPISKTKLNHEKIHTKQLIETLFIGFYILYGFMWLYNLIKYKDKDQAYYKIPFEIEAYNNEKDYYYLDNRKIFSWLC